MSGELVAGEAASTGTGRYRDRYMYKPFLSLLGFIFSRLFARLFCSNLAASNSALRVQ